MIDIVIDTALLTNLDTNKDTASNELSVAESQPQDTTHCNPPDASRENTSDTPSDTPSDNPSDNPLDHQIQQCIDANQHHIDACCHCNVHNAPQVVRLQLDIESIIRKLAFYIVLFASFAFVIYEIIQLYVYTMPFECTIGILLCFAFVINFDIHRIQGGLSLPTLSPLSALSSFIPLYKF